jgi:serine/threonine-protein kinase
MDGRLTPDELRIIDEVCDEFEESWQNGQPPRVEDCLERVPAPLREPLVDALLLLYRELLVGSRNVRPAPGRQAAIKPIANSNPVSRDVPDLNPKPPSEVIASQAAMGVVSLEVIEGPHCGQVFEFHRHATLVTGRSPAAQLKLENDPHFSRHHFRLEINPPTCYLLDLDSRNGTWVNGARVSEFFLSDGDIISGGRTQIRIRIRGTKDVPSSADEGGTRSALFQFAETDSTKIPGYELLNLVGRGDLGATFRARHLASKTEVSIKLVQPSSVAQHRDRTTFIRDVSRFLELTHPHIVRLREVAYVSEYLYFVYDFVPDEGCLVSLEAMSLAQRIRCACHWMYQVLGALHATHTRGFVHRDLKPSNILVAQHNNRWKAMLSDFGIAKHFADAGLSPIARSGDFPKSLPYMSPQLFIDSRNTDVSSDIYSAGATLYHWLTGATPHDLSKQKCQYLAILDHEPVPITDRLQQIPPALAKIVHCALARHPHKRFPTATAMAKDIRGFLEQR